MCECVCGCMVTSVSCVQGPRGSDLPGARLPEQRLAAEEGREARREAVRHCTLPEEVSRGEHRSVENK